MGDISRATSIMELLDEEDKIFSTERIEALRKRVASHHNLSITDGVAIPLSTNPENDAEEDKSIREDFITRIEFLGAFSRMYNCAHHLLSQLEQYNQQLKHTEVINDAMQEHHQGLLLQNNILQIYLFPYRFAVVR